MLQTTNVELTPEGEAQLLQVVLDQLGPALETHKARETFLAKLMRAYKARPEHETKNFPWPNASNVVVPLVAITVDAIQARLQKTILGLTEYFEVQIKSAAWEPLEKDLREWSDNFIRTAGCRDRLRTAFSLTPRDGECFFKLLWVEEKRKYHAYNEAGQVTELEVPGYVGVRWYVIPDADVVFPNGFDDFQTMPWVAVHLRPTWAELKQGEKDGLYYGVDRLRGKAKDRDDARFKETETAARTVGNPAQIYDLYEIYGLYEVAPDRFEELVLVVSVDHECILRKIFNPYFGKSRHLVRMPYLLQPLEPRAMGAAEMALPFQEENSTIHNQVIDAATAANAGIIVVSPETNMGENEEVYPGKRLVTPKPREDVQVLHLNEPSQAALMLEQRSAYLAEKRTGVSSYNLGLESQVVGSQATATGTTAILGEGSIRFAVAIDDVRAAIEELMYLTIQQEQQMRPAGHEWAKGRYIQFPQGDVRTSIGLKLRVSSETINKDLEVQSLQLLMTVLNEYYARLMQASAMIFNPMFPPEQKLVAMRVMTGMQNIIARFVERFDIENTEEVVPNLLLMLQGVAGVLSGQSAMGAVAPGGPQIPPGLPPGGPGQGAPGTANGSNVGGPLAGAGPGQVPPLSTM
jgi:hypothetical protein